MNRIAYRLMSRPWFAGLLLAAVVARALVPVGFMPGKGGLMLCTAVATAPARAHDGDRGGAGDTDMSGMDMAGMEMAGMDMPGMPMDAHHAGSGAHHHPGHSAGGSCPFAAAPTAVTLAPFACCALPPPPVAVAVVFPPAQSVPRGTIVPTRLPRGPPIGA